MMVLKIALITIAGLYVLDRFYWLLVRENVRREAQFLDHRHENDER